MLAEARQPLDTVGYNACMSGSNRSIYLPDEQWAALDEMAKAEDRAVSYLVRRGVMHIIQRGLDQLPDQERALAGGTWARILETKDEEIARLKRELAKRPLAGKELDRMVGYARQSGARGIPEVDAAIEAGAKGTITPFLEPAARRATQKLVDDVLAKVNRKAKP